MIRCTFARLLGERKIKISDVARDTGINRGTLTRLYFETAERIDLAVLDQLCDYFEVDLPELLYRATESDADVPKLK
jgi:putative transcriptional regulator